MGIFRIKRFADAKQAVKASKNMVELIKEGVRGGSSFRTRSKYGAVPVNKKLIELSKNIKK